MRLRRFGAAMLAFLIVMSSVTSTLTTAVRAQQSPDSTLALIVFGDWAGLHRLRPLGLDVLDVRDSTLLADVTALQLAQVRKMGLQVRILDHQPETDRYYVVLPPRDGPSELDGPPALLPYVDGLYLAEGEPREIDRLVGLGFMLDKLMGGVVLPDSPPQFIVPAAVEAGPDPLIQSLVSQVAAANVQNTIRDLQDEDELPGWDHERSRYSYSDELPIERDYLRNRLISHGLSVRYDSFSLGGRILQNVEATLPGQGPDADVVYIACAHYDSITTDGSDRTEIAPGADDNASGTSAVIEAARVLSRYRFERTLRFVLFPGEEQGMYGSKHYAADMRGLGADIRGVVNLDMVGWDSNNDGVMEIHAGTRSDSQGVGNLFRTAISTYGLALYPDFWTSGSLTFSDHDSFWDRGYPAILAIERYHGDWNSNYHQATDTLENTVRVSYATDFTRATVATLAGMARIIPPGLKVEHAGPARVTAGSPVTLAVRYSNTGPDPLTGVVVTGTLLAGLSYTGDTSGVAPVQPTPGSYVWSLPDLAPHAAASFSILATVPAPLEPGAHVTTTISGAASSPWALAADNQATWVGMVPVDVQDLPIIEKETP